MKWFKLIIPASLNYSEAIRTISAEVVEDSWSFSKKEKNMIKLVVDELYMNAVRYWSSKSSSVLIEWWFEEWNVVFAVEDEWQWKNKITADDLRKIISEEKKNNDIRKTHWRWLAQITWAMTTAFDVLNWDMWWIRVEFSKKAGHINKTSAKEKKITPESINPALILEKKEFTLKWEMDLSNSEEKIVEIEKYVNSVEYPVKIILNCKDLTFFNSTFIGHLAWWYSSVSKFWWALVLSDMSDEVFEIIDLIWLTSILHIENNN